MINQKICQVWNCDEIAKYINPDNKFYYCQKHYDKLGGKIIYQKGDSNNGIPEKSVKLIKIEIPFNIDNINMDGE